MEEIKIGENIRTKKGTIARIKDTEFDICFNLSGQVFYKKWICDKCFCEEIVKHSKNIIEEGDIVLYTIKGLEHSTYIDIVKEYVDDRTLKSELRVELFSLEQINILKILTKEKFESECFRLKEGQDV